MCMCMYVYVYVYMCMCVYVCACMCVYVCVCMCMYVCVFVCVSLQSGTRVVGRRLCVPMTTCAIFTLYIYSSIGAAPLWTIIEQSDKYWWEIAYQRNWGYRKCCCECSLGVYLAIGTFYVLSDALYIYSSIGAAPLWTIIEQSDKYWWEIAYQRNWGYRKCCCECSLGVYLAIGTFYVLSDALPLHTIVRQSSNWLLRYCNYKL